MRKSKNKIRYTMIGIHYAFLICILIAATGCMNNDESINQDVENSHLELLTHEKVEDSIKDKGLALQEVELDSPLTEEVMWEGSAVRMKSYKVGEHQNHLFVYEFESVADRMESFPMDYHVTPSQLDEFAHLFDEDYKLASAKNVFILYDPVELDNIEIKSELEQLRDAVFYGMHDIQEEIFRGHGDNWEVEVQFEFYEYEWTNNKEDDELEFYGYYEFDLQYLNDNVEDLSYIRCKYFYNKHGDGSGTTSQSSQETLLDENGRYSFDNHMDYPLKKDEVIEFVIRWEDQEEELELEPY
ncbi:hypothetical protein [Natranaerobius thermophilus]|uniref:Lipoprotein n=1 Tax=Natranaerobius thermophilus (strain ATCC BAA-1301 / DSM 18059 / JW/NM-WN-LF) TaxID=457570 RepID=B2A7N0_NATTJ|nr:hypothetical protein [Natranaerobius thermophilus]ACB85739.1 hypothetical protein Nther_2173 [Natranaerobius thermophilus JW/NM-WN-LF]